MIRKAAAALSLAFAATVAGAGTVGATPENPTAPEPCPTLPADRVNDAVNRLPQAFPDVPWQVTGSGSSIDCALNWVQVDPQGATGSSPSHILLFDHFKYGGTATEDPEAFVTVAGSAAPGQITITFRWLNPGDANANPTGRADVRYQLFSQSPPGPIDPIPAEVTG